MRSFLSKFLGWVSISSQLITSKGPLFFFFLPPTSIPFPGVCSAFCQHGAWQISSSRLHGHSGKPNPGTCRKFGDFLRAIFSVLICTARALAALQRPLCTFSVFFVGFGQIACCSLPVVSLIQALKTFCSNASSRVALAMPNAYFSAVYPESHSDHFPFFPFALHHPVASLAAMSAISFPFIFVWAGI